MVEIVDGLYFGGLRFFVPAARDTAHAEELYSAIYRFDREQMHAELSPARIQQRERRA